MSIAVVYCIPRNPGPAHNAGTKDKPAGCKLACKRDATRCEFEVSYLGVARPARNGDCLAGLELGALQGARGSISDFATLVRKSYSGFLSLVSTLVLVEHFLFSWRTWER